MAFFRYLLIVVALAPALALVPAAQAQQPRQNNIAVDLVAEHDPVPGEVLTAALVFRPAPGWHGYWSNPGDAGLGMRLDWRLPEGWQAGEPLYPVPRQLVITGLMNHVYKGEYAVLVPITVPAGAARGPVSVKADWLACTDQICVPEQAELTLRVPQAGGANPFDAYRAALPPLIDRPATFAIAGKTLRVAIPLPASMAIADPHLFVGQDRIAADRTVSYAAPQAFFRQGDMLVAEVPLKELTLPPGSPLAQFVALREVSGILAFGEDGNGIRFVAAPGDVPTGGERLAGSAGAVDAPLWSLVLAALAGGLLLNLMPCVFPILSLKAMTLARAGESEKQARAEALAYTAGVMLACLGIGALLLVLRAGGEQVGWAFQLQEPGVVAALLALAILITANFAGFLELPSLPITQKGGGASAFATGLLAAFVATPCTGPFMAAALGAALLLPPLPAMLLFAMLGLGLALPFLLLGFVPALRSRLPRPGAWMDRFRRILAVPMGLTALALGWLCWRLGGEAFALFTAGAALLVVYAAWAHRKGLKASAMGALVASALLAVSAYQYFERPGQSAESLLEPVEFSEAALADARASGRPVFLWFTADWCVSCKVNESVAIEREATRAAFEEGGVIAMRGDWTVRDEEITRFLTAHGAAGVPLYLWYPAGGEGEQLPQVLTPALLTERAAVTD